MYTQNLQDEKKDDFAINQLLRKRFRVHAIIYNYIIYCYFR